MDKEEAKHIDSILSYLNENFNSRDTFNIGSEIKKHMESLWIDEYDKDYYEKTIRSECFVKHLYDSDFLFTKEWKDFIDGWWYYRELKDAEDKDTIQKNTIRQQQRNTFSFYLSIFATAISLVLLVYTFFFEEKASDVTVREVLEKISDTLIPQK